MVKRERLEDRVSGGGNYFSRPKTNLKFIKTGCEVLDLALGGGWCEGRIANIVGDKSSCKTLLCIEAMANFANKYPKGRILYRECESAFDDQYAAALGMPVEQVDRGEPFETVEDVFDDLTEQVKSDVPTLYILDSLDALSDREEMQRDMEEGTYGMGKAKKMSQLFRRLVRKMERSNLTLIIVSQVRSKIGVSFGRMTTRSGGRALDFFASQVLYLQHIGQETRSISGVKRSTGIHVKAKVDKNKVSLPLREAEFYVSFGYGIDDCRACLEWLKDVGSLPEVDIAANKIKTFSRKLIDGPPDDYKDEMDFIHEVVRRRWYEIERKFLPRRSKYGSN